MISPTFSWSLLIFFPMYSCPYVMVSWSKIDSWMMENGNTFGSKVTECFTFFTMILSNIHHISQRKSGRIDSYNYLSYDLYIFWGNKGLVESDEPNNKKLRSLYLHSEVHLFLQKKYIMKIKIYFLIFRNNSHSQASYMQEHKVSTPEISQLVFSILGLKSASTQFTCCQGSLIIQ